MYTYLTSIYIGTYRRWIPSETSVVISDSTEALCSPPAGRASLERSSSADHPPALLVSSPGPSHISAPPGSAPPVEQSWIMPLISANLQMTGNCRKNTKTVTVLWRGPRAGWAQVWCPAPFSPSSAGASACGIDPWSAQARTGVLQETTTVLQRGPWRDVRPVTPEIQSREQNVCLFACF